MVPVPSVAHGGAARLGRSGHGVVTGVRRTPGALRRGLDPDDAAGTVWMVTSPEVRHMLLTTRGWSRQQYEACLLHTLQRTLFPEPAEDA